MRNRRLVMAAGVGLIVLMTCVAYVPAVRAGYIWDDDYYVTQNVHLRSLEGLGRIWFQLGAVPQYYPLVHTTFWIEYHLWRLNPVGYHVGNILLHALNAVLLWRVLRRLAVPGAWVVAGVFALHPVCVESVAWVTERKNVLSGLFYLASVLAYLHFCKIGAPPGTEPTPRRRWGLCGLALALYLCALLSKTVTSSMPAAMILVLWWKRDRPRWRDLWPLIPFFILGICPGLVTVWMEKHHVGAAGEEWNLSFLDRCLIAGRALCFYAGKLVWPTKLMFMYPRWHVSASVWWQYLYPLAPAAVVVGLWCARKRLGKAPLVAVLYFGGTLFPALGFFDVYPMRYSFVADHFQYLACIGVLALGIGGATASVNTSGRLNRRSAVVGCALLFGLLGYLTWRQAEVYRSPEALWRDTIRKNPTSWMAYNNLGNRLAQQGRLADAQACYENVIRLNPKHANAYNNLGNIFMQRGDYNSALNCYRQALSIQPDHIHAVYNLGALLCRLGRYREAEPYLARTLKVNPKLADARKLMGKVLLRLMKPEQAEEELSKAAVLAPRDAETHLLLAVTLRSLGRRRDAAGQCDEAVRLQPEDPVALGELALILIDVPERSADDTARALSCAEKAARLTAYASPRYQAILARAYAALGRFKEAAGVAQKAHEQAKAGGNAALAAVIEKHAKLYRKGLEPPSTDAIAPVPAP